MEGQLNETEESYIFLFQSIIVNYLRTKENETMKSHRPRKEQTIKKKRIMTHLKE